LEALQVELNQLTEAASTEVLKIEHKYNKLKQPIYKQRSGVIERIPDFWLRCFINNSQLRGILEDSDKDILHHLKDISFNDSADERSYTLTMKFSPNTFFSNEFLTKEYSYNPHNELNIISSPINWINPDFVKQHEESLFVTWFDQADPLEFLGDLIREVIYKDPLAAFYQCDSQEIGEEDQDDLVDLDEQDYQEQDQEQEEQDQEQEDQEEQDK